MATKETSADISALAARTLRRKPARARMVDGGTYNDLLEDAQRLAGSALSQDETRGAKRRPSSAA